MRALWWIFRGLEFGATVVGVVFCMGAVERWGWAGLLVLLPAALVGAGFHECARRVERHLRDHDPRQGTFWKSRGVGPH